MSRPRGSAWLDRIERAGNALPDPATLFLLGTVAVILLSQLAVGLDWSVEKTLLTELPAGAGTFDTLMSLSVARCNNQAMVVPGDPTASAFYNVLTDNCSNFRMPPSCPSNHCTGEENVQLVESWILDGAPEN